MKILCPADWAASFPLIKRKLPAAAAPSGIIVDEYPITGASVCDYSRVKFPPKNVTIKKRGKAKGRWALFWRMFLCPVLWTACDLNVNVFMFRSHQWALPGWRTPFWRYSPSVFSSCIRCCHFLLMGVLQLARLRQKHLARSGSQQPFSSMCGFIQTFPFHAALRCVCGSAFQTAE